MRIIRSLNEDFNIHQKTSVALGTFDGVHIAHQEVIKKMVKHAKLNNLLSVVYTFSNHPKEINDNLEAPKKLLTPTQKIDIIKLLGVDILIIVPFDLYQLNIDALDFLETVIVHKINAKHITVGYDFRFGNNAKGCVNLLREHANHYDYNIEVIEPIRHNGVIVSSTVIRNYLLNGQVRHANQLLGRIYCIKGLVIQGKQIGRKLGFPTINLQTEFEMSVLKPGVYVTETNIDGTLYYSVTNVGFNPTFNQEDFNIETYILDFDGDLYAKQVRVFFLKYIRPEIKFAEIDALIDQINDDVAYAKKYFNI